MENCENGSVNKVNTPLQSMFDLEETRIMVETEINKVFSEIDLDENVKRMFRESLTSFYSTGLELVNALKQEFKVE